MIPFSFSIGKKLGGFLRTFFFGPRFFLARKATWWHVPLYVVFGFWFLVSAPPAHALSPLCTQILTLPSVSDHYVERVIKRADDALTYLETYPANPDFGLIVPDWVKSIYSSAVGLIDTTQRLTLFTLSLEDHTSCLTLDALRIQCEIEKTFDSMNASLQKGSWLPIREKQALILDLDERLRHLQTGATDPTYVDTTWGQRSFDAPDVQMTDRFLCPYHTDYLHVANGYGCALPVLQPRKAYEPADAEYQGLLSIQEQIDTNQLLVQNLAELERQINILKGGGNPGAPPPPAPPTHRIGYGCTVPPGFCSLSPKVRCANTKGCAPTRGACILDTGYCERNILRTCNTNAECGAENLGACVPGTPPEPVRFVRSGVFDAEENTIAILRKFLLDKIKQGGSREYRSSLKLPSEFPPGQGPAVRDAYSALTRNTGRLIVRTWSRLQAAWEAAIFPRATDVPLALADASALRAPIATLAKLATDDDGLKSVITGIALDFRLSCMFRPCRAKLEHVLKLNSARACFPYTHGEFIDDLKELAENPDAEPRYVKCAKAACVRLPGVQSPPECNEIP